jgi:serpin B
MIPLLVNAGNTREIVEGNNKFALKLFHEIKDDTKQNLFLSPFSISTALGMTFAGARNETALEMSRTLNFPGGETIHSDFRQLLTRMDAGTEGKIKFNIANGLWAQQDFPFLGSYLDLVKNNYKSEIKNVNFKDDLERENVRKEINTWVEQKTYDKIKDLLDRSDLDTGTKLILVNAIYFYGDWATPFTNESTHPKEFTLTDGTRIRMPDAGYRMQDNRYYWIILSAFFNLHFLTILISTLRFASLSASVFSG